jgi:uncharacterized protein (DUF885 family)
VSLVETRRVDGKVRHEHIAGLGSIPRTPSVADRMSFWSHLHERLAKLSNRIDAAAQAKILGAIHARVAMVTADEQHGLKLENAQADERLWSSLREINEGTIADHKQLIANAEATVARRRVAALDAETNAMQARDRVERLKRGEGCSWRVRATNRFRTDIEARRLDQAGRGPRQATGLTTRRSCPRNCQGVGEGIRARR